MRHGTGQKGMTLIEVMIALAVLGIAVTGTLSAIMSCHRMNSRSRQETVALAAAQEIVAQIRNTASRDVVTNFNGMTFSVPELPRIAGVADHGEVIIISDETPDEAAYARDIEAPAGPDGLDLNGDGDTWDILTVADPNSAFPRDLDGDGLTTNEAVAADRFRLIPVVVLVRWQASPGIGRVQLVTFITDRNGRGFTNP